ncbi:MAG TPA: hypothetical protein VF103_15065 [Polyangiaceae bacterium]
MVPVWSLPLFVPGVFAAPPVIFEGATDCPTHEAISRELERIVSAPADSAPSEAAVVAREGSELRIVLTTRDGRLLGERRLPADGTCDELALSVAVVLGAWIATAHPEYSSPLPESESGSESKNESAAAPAEPPAPPPLAAPVAAVPATRPPEPAPKPPAPPVPNTEPARRFEVALGIGGELSDAGLVPATEAGVRYRPEASGFGASAFVLVAAPETREIGAGSVSSFRWPLGVGATGRLVRAGLSLELEGGAMLGLLRLEGDGFASNGDATDAQGGLYGTLRVGAASGKLRPFVAAKLLTWLGKATAEASLPDAEVDLPVVEGVLLVGLGFVP